MLQSDDGHFMVSHRPLQHVHLGAQSIPFLRQLAQTSSQLATKALVHVGRHFSLCPGAQSLNFRLTVTELVGAMFEIAAQLAPYSYQAVDFRVQ